MTSDIQTAAATCADYIRQAQNIVLLSGAGLSTAAGIPDFRGPHGLYTKARIKNPELIFDLDVFDEDPAPFYEFHREFLKMLDRLEPTYAHRFFAALEKEGKLKAVITQNIDSLHHRAGSQTVYEIHGGIWNTFCRGCGMKYDHDKATELTLADESKIPVCESCGGVLKPDIVFFGEPVKFLMESQDVIRQSDLLFVVGSSLTVTPAAMLPNLARGRIVVINKGPTSPYFLPPSRIDLFVDSYIDDFIALVDKHLDLLED